MTNKISKDRFGKDHIFRKTICKEILAKIIFEDEKMGRQREAPLCRRAMNIHYMRLGTSPAGLDSGLMQATFLVSIR